MIVNRLTNKFVPLLRSLNTNRQFLFCNDKTWKERDEAAERVYISRKESNSPLMFRRRNEETSGKANTRPGARAGDCT